MSRNQSSKRRGRRTAVTVLGAAGALSVASGASAAIVGPAEDIPAKDTASRPVINLSEEEVVELRGDTQSDLRRGTVTCRAHQRLLPSRLTQCLAESIEDLNQTLPMVELARPRPRVVRFCSADF
jgi:hypothetical protein